MGSHFVQTKWEDGRLQPKHVAKYNLIVIIASCLDVCCVLTVQNILYKSDIHNGMACLKAVGFAKQQEAQRKKRLI